MSFYNGSIKYHTLCFIYICIYLLSFCTLIIYTQDKPGVLLSCRISPGCVYKEPFLLIKVFHFSSPLASLALFSLLSLPIVASLTLLLLQSGLKCTLSGYDNNLHFYAFTLTRHSPSCETQISPSC